MTHPTGVRLNLWATLGAAIIAGATAFATLPSLGLVSWATVTVSALGAVVGASVVHVFSSSLDRKLAGAFVTVGVVAIVVVCFAGRHVAKGVAQQPQPAGSSRIEPSPYPTPGAIRFYDAEIDPNSTYPDALVPATEPPTVQAEQISGYHTPPALQFTMRHLGISHIELTVDDPRGHSVSVIVFTSTEDTMTLAYNVAREIAGTYALTIVDTDSGARTTSTIDLAAEPYKTDMRPVGIGLLPGAKLSTITGHACDQTGAHVSVKGSQVMQGDLLTAYLPAGVTASLGKSHDYRGAVDNWGNAYWDVVIKAEHCTNKNIDGFRFVIMRDGHPTRAELDNVSIPN